MAMILIDKIFMLLKITFYYVYAAWYIVNRSVNVSMEDTVSLCFKSLFLIVLSRLYRTDEGSSILNYRERDFLQYLNGVLNLGLCSRIFAMEKHRNRKGRTL